MNGIAGVVNTDVITYRDIEIFSGIRELAGDKIKMEEALNQLIEESIVFQSAMEQGIEPDENVITQCTERLNQIVKEKRNASLEKAGYIEKDGEKRCLRAETMKLFIEKKFLKPLIVSAEKVSDEDLEEYKKNAIESYKEWLSDIIQKFKIEKLTGDIINLEKQ